MKDGIVYCSGAIGITGKGPHGPIFAGTDVKSQTKQVLENLAAILAAAGSSMDKVRTRTQGTGPFACKLRSRFILRARSRFLDVGSSDEDIVGGVILKEL